MKNNLNQSNSFETTMKSLNYMYLLLSNQICYIELELYSHIEIEFQKCRLHDDVFMCRCPDGYAGQQCEVFLTSLLVSSLIGIAGFVLSLAQCLLFGICLCSRRRKNEQVQQVIQR